MTYDLNITFDDNLVTGNETIDTQHIKNWSTVSRTLTACQMATAK